MLLVDSRNLVKIAHKLVVGNKIFYRRKDGLMFPRRGVVEYINDTHVAISHGSDLYTHVIDDIDIFAVCDQDIDHVYILVAYSSDGWDDRVEHVAAFSDADSALDYFHEHDYEDPLDYIKVERF